MKYKLEEYIDFVANREYEDRETYDDYAWNYMIIEFENILYLLKELEGIKQNISEYNLIVTFQDYELYNHVVHNEDYEYYKNNKLISEKNGFGFKRLLDCLGIEYKKYMYDTESDRVCI